MSERTLIAPEATRAALMAKLAHAAVPPRQPWTGDGPLPLSAKSLKCTVVLDPAQLVGIMVPNGTSRVPFAINIGSRAITGEFNAKSLRRAVAAIAEHGADAIAVVVQGKLAGNQIEEAGIAAQVKGK